MTKKVTIGSVFNIAFFILSAFAALAGAYMIYLDFTEPVGYALLIFGIFIVTTIFMYDTGRWENTKGDLSGLDVNCKNCGKTSSLDISDGYLYGSGGTGMKTAYDNYCPYCRHKLF